MSKGRNVSLFCQMHNRIHYRVRSNVLPTHHYVGPIAVYVQNIASAARPYSCTPLCACTWNVLKIPTEFIVGHWESEHVVMSKCRTEDNISEHLSVKTQSFQVYQHIKSSFILKCRPWNWNGCLVVEICLGNVLLLHWSDGKRPTVPLPARLSWISGMLSWRCFQTHK